MPTKVSSDDVNSFKSEIRKGTLVPYSETDLSKAMEQKPFASVIAYLVIDKMVGLGVPGLPGRPRFRAVDVFAPVKRKELYLEFAKITDVDLEHNMLQIVIGSRAERNSKHRVWIPSNLAYFVTKQQHMKTLWDKGEADKRGAEREERFKAAREDEENKEVNISENTLRRVIREEIDRVLEETDPLGVSEEPTPEVDPRAQDQLAQLLRQADFANRVGDWKQVKKLTRLIARVTAGISQSSGQWPAYIKEDEDEDLEYEEKRVVTAYHGSNVPIQNFSRDHGAQGVMWFSEDKDKIIRGESGALSSKYIMKVELNVENTTGWDDYDEKFLQQIEDEGFDSIQLDDDWIVFDPARVKVVGVEER